MDAIGCIMLRKRSPCFPRQWCKSYPMSPTCTTMSMTSLSTPSFTGHDTTHVHKLVSYVIITRTTINVLIWLYGLTKVENCLLKRHLPLLHFDVALSLSLSLSLCERERDQFDFQHFKKKMKKPRMAHVEPRFSIFANLCRSAGFLQIFADMCRSAGFLQIFADMCRFEEK